MSHEGIPSCIEVSLLLTDDEEIRGLNREYRNKDKATDVLSFPNFNLEEISLLKSMGTKATGLFDAGSPNAYLGDIAISVPQATKQAQEQGHPLENELAILTVHAVLHLLGYDHEQAEDEATLMFDRQTSILGSMGVEWRWQL